MYQLNKKATDLYYENVIEKKIIDEPQEWIVKTILDQEIVSFCTSEGCVSFDTSDIEFIEE